MGSFLTTLGEAAGVAAIAMIVTFIGCKTYFACRLAYIKQTLKLLNTGDTHGKANTSIPISKERSWHYQNPQQSTRR